MSVRRSCVNDLRIPNDREKGVTRGSDILGTEQNTWCYTIGGSVPSPVSINNLFTRLLILLV